MEQLPDVLPLHPYSNAGCMEDLLCMNRDAHGTIFRHMLFDPLLVQC